LTFKMWELFLPHPVYVYSHEAEVRRISQVSVPCMNQTKQEASPGICYSINGRRTLALPFKIWHLASKDSKTPSETEKQ